MYPISEVDNGAIAFASEVEHLMPKYSDIPADFKKISNKWNLLFNHWFFKGIKIEPLVPKEGVEIEKALRHINAVMRSYEISHEHKAAAVAFLLSEWFEDVLIGADNRP